jgi:c-di-GMP-binding flagellar brake protein YcgR
MTATAAWEMKMSNTIGGDRRSDKRYSLQLDVRWKLIRRRKVLETGHGTTIDLSSGGILLEADRPLPNGLNLELAISWPVMLRNTAALQLVAIGRITRVNGNRVAIRMVQHDFRTAGVHPEHPKALAPAQKPPRFFSGRARLM